MQLSTYQAIQAVAQVLDENYDAIQYNTSGTELARMLFGREFAAGNGLLRISNIGTRVADVNIALFNNRTQAFEVTIVC